MNPAYTVQQAGRIFVIRHGQTAGNKHRYVGWDDLPLDAVGRAQAQALADALADEPIDAIMSSPLQRALATAQPLADRRALGVQAHHDLKEIHYGDYQGLLKTERALKLRKQFVRVALPGGESLFDVYRRATHFAAALHPALLVGCKLAVVGHFWSNRMLVGVLQQLSFDEIIARSGYKPDNGSVYQINSVVGAADQITIVSATWLDTTPKEIVR